MSKTFNQNFEELIQEYHAKKTIPDWFTTGYKTLVSKNVTIEDWNRMYLYLQNLASDDEVLLKLLEFVKNNIEQRFEDFKKENDLVIEGQWASDIYTENLHVDVIRNDPEFYFMDNTGRFQSHRISEKPDFTYVDTNYVSLTKSQAIDGVKEFKNILKIIGDDTKGRIIPTVNDTGSIGQSSNHFKQGYINQMIAYQVLPIEKTGTSLGTGIGSIGNANNRWLNATIDNIVTKSILINNKAAATEDFVNSKISELLNSAPETLDTLAELAEALGKDPNFATTIANQIGNKADRTELPKNLSELNNDAGYLVPSSLTNYATKTFVADEIRKAQLETEDVDLSIFYTKTEINEREIYTFVDLTPTGIDYADYKVIAFFNMLQDLGYADLTNGVMNSLKIKLKFDAMPINFLEFKFYTDEELQIVYASQETPYSKYIGTYFAYSLDDADSTLFSITEELGEIINSSNIYEYLNNYLPKSGGEISGNLGIGGQLDTSTIYATGAIQTEQHFYSENGISTDGDLYVGADASFDGDVHTTENYTVNAHCGLIYDYDEPLGFVFKRDGTPALRLSSNSDTGPLLYISPHPLEENLGFYLKFEGASTSEIGTVLLKENLTLYNHNILIQGTTTNNKKFFFSFAFTDLHWGYATFKDFLEEYSSLNRYFSGFGFVEHTAGASAEFIYRLSVFVNASSEEKDFHLYYVYNSVGALNSIYTSSNCSITSFKDDYSVALKEV